MKKIISLVLVITLLSAFFVTASAEDVLLTAPADTATEEVIPQEPAVDYSQYVNFVQGLKIMPEGEAFDGAANIKRGEFASYIYNILYKNNFDTVDTWYDDLYAPDNYDQLVAPDTGVSYFDDVDKGYDYYEAISKLREIRIMNGTGERTFEPDAEITFAEASAVLVRVLGYEFYAKKYPYIPVATMLGIFKGLDYEADRKITHNELAKALYNCASIDITVAEYSSDAKAYKQLKGETIYSQFMDIHFKKGTVTGNSLTSLYGTKGHGNNKAEIGGVIYNTQFAPYVGNMIGRDIDFFYRVNPVTEAKEIVYATTTKRDNVLTVKPSDFESFKNETLTYYIDEDKTEEVEFVGNPVLIYNGVYKAPFDESIFDFINGDITLIAPDGSDYKYIVINDYKSYLVTAVDTVAEKIYATTYEDKIRNFDIRALKDYQVQYILEDGTEGNITNVGVGNIIDVLETDSSIKFNITKNAVTGFFVGGSYTDDTLYVCNAEEVYYPVLPSFYKYAKENGEKALINGKVYNVYFNSFGQIVYAEPTVVAATDTKAYILGSKASSRLGQIGTIEFMNDKGIINALPVAKNATIITQDGVKAKIKSSSDFAAYIDAYLANNQYARIFELSIAEDNTITKINIPTMDSLDRKGEFGVMGKLNAEGYAEYMWCQGRVFFENVMIADNAIIYHYNPEGRNDKEKYAVLKKTELTSVFTRDGQMHKVVPYNYNADSVTANCLIIIDGGAKTNELGLTLYSASYLVDKVLSAKDAEGTPITKVEAYQITTDGNALKKVTLTAEPGVFENTVSIYEDVPARPVRKGDIIGCTKYGEMVTSCYVYLSIYNEAGKIDFDLVGTPKIKGDESDTPIVGNTDPVNPYWVSRKGVISNSYRSRNNFYRGTDYFQIFFGNAYDVEDGKYFVHTTQPIDLGVPYDITMSDTRYSTQTIQLPTNYITITLKGNNMNAAIGKLSDIKTYKTTGINCSKVFAMTNNAQFRVLVIINQVK